MMGAVRALRKVSAGPGLSMVEVPDEIGDAHAFAVRYAFEQLNSRGDW